MKRARDEHDALGLMSAARRKVADSSPHDLVSALGEAMQAAEWSLGAALASPEGLSGTDRNAWAGLCRDYRSCLHSLMTDVAPNGPPGSAGLAGLALEAGRAQALLAAIEGAGDAPAVFRAAPAGRAAGSVAAPSRRTGTGGAGGKDAGRGSSGDSSATAAASSSSTERSRAARVRLETLRYEDPARPLCREREWRVHSASDLVAAGSRAPLPLTESGMRVTRVRLVEQ